MKHWKRVCIRSGVVAIAWLGAFADARANEPVEVGADPSALAERLRRDYLELARSAAAMEKELAQLRVERRALEQRLRELEEVNRRAEAETVRLREEVRRQGETAVAAMEQLRSALREKVAAESAAVEKERAFEDLRRRYRQLEKAVVDLEAWKVKAEELQQERDRLLRERTRSERGRAPSAAANDAAASAEVERLKYLADQERAVFQALRERLESQYAELEQTLARERRQAADALERLTRRIESLKARWEAAEMALAAERRARAEEAKREDPTAPTDRMVSVGRADKRQAEGEQKEAEWQATAQRARELERRLADLEKERDLLRRELETLTQHAVEQEDTIAMLKSEISQLGAVAARAAEVDTLRRALDAARERAAALQALLMEKQAMEDHGGRALSSPP